MKKIFIFLMMITSFLLVNNNVVVFGAFNEDVDDAYWTYNANIFYNTNTYQNEGVGIGFDLGGATSTYYDGDYVDWRTFFEDVDKIKLSDYNGFGDINIADYHEYTLDFSFNYITSGLTIDFYGQTDNYLTGAYTLLDSAFVTLDYEDVPLFYYGFDAMASAQLTSDNDQSISLRIGKVPVHLSWNISAHSIAHADSVWDNTTSYDVGFKILNNTGAITSPNYLVSNTDVYISNLIAVDTDFITLIEFYAYFDGYNQAVLDGQQVNLLDIFNVVVGWLVTFVLFFFNLTIFGLSLLDILSIGVLIVGLTWLLKLIRG